MVPLKELKLWWPALQIGIPITAYGFTDQGRIHARGPGYSFIVDPELDSWLTPDNKLMPISTASLIVFNRVAPARVIRYSSFAQCADGKVQVNVKHEAGGFEVLMYSLDELYMNGETYSDDD